MNTKIIISGVAVVLLLAVAVGAYVYGPGMLPKESTQPEVAEGPAIVGGLVGIGSSTITVKSQDGKEMTFTISPKTPVFSQVADGELGRVYNQLSVGDVLSVTAKNNSSDAKQIEIIPLATSTPAGTTVSSVAGTIVDISGTSVTVKPAPNDPIMQMTVTNKTFTITNSTKFVTKVLGGQTGKPMSAFTKGATILVTSHSGAADVAQSVMLLY